MNDSANIVTHAPGHPDDSKILRHHIPDGFYCLVRIDVTGMTEQQRQFFMWQALSAATKIKKDVLANDVFIGEGGPSNVKIKNDLE